MVLKKNMVLVPGLISLVLDMIINKIKESLGNLLESDNYVTACFVGDAVKTKRVYKYNTKI